MTEQNDTRVYCPSCGSSHPPPAAAVPGGACSQDPIIECPAVVANGALTVKPLYRLSTLRRIVEAHDA